MARVKRIALVYGAPAGVGGLGVQVASAIQALGSETVELHAFGPGRADRWPFPSTVPNVNWHVAPTGVAPWRARYTSLRWRQGRLVFENSRAIGRWAAAQIDRLKPDACYAFTQVGLETLNWARRANIPAVIESPNGHIRNFRRVNENESRRLCGAPFRGHPTAAMVERVEQEYQLSSRMRVSSRWSRHSMLSNGVMCKEIAVFEQPIDLSRYLPHQNPATAAGPLRICFVGSLDLRKGFVYLLRAVKMIGDRRLSLEIVGATGDRCCRKLFEQESEDIAIRCTPGDPIPAYRRAEVFVLPTLEDGSPFAAAEAMACGLPSIVTDCCGASEWVRPGESGWIVPGGDASALAAALEDAISRRAELSAMGRLAREDTERRAGLDCLLPFRQWMFQQFLQCS
jgi:glycosyltransferase involved in cell wall biosynthesis